MIFRRPFAFWSISLLFASSLIACSSDDSSNNGIPSPDAGSEASTPAVDAASSVADVSAAMDEASIDVDGVTAEDALGAAEDVATDQKAAVDGPASDGAPQPSGPCASLPGTIVYVESGDTQENLLKNLGRKLRDSAGITLVYNLAGSCTLTSDVYAGTNMVPNGTLKYIPSTSENAAWTPSQVAASCTTGAEGAPIDVAISALFVESCGLGGPPQGSSLALIQGPVQAYTFIVPTASSQNAIWAEEAYYAFGFGNANPLAPTYNPWNQEAFMFIRPTTKSTLVATAKNIAVPPNKWKGVAQNASSDVVTAVTNSASPDATIGILGAEVYDGARNKGMKTLAFQAFGQSGAYYPDSTSTAFDKQNVRDGHYTLWSPTVYITKVDGASQPQNPGVKKLVDVVLGNAGSVADGAAGIDGLSDVIKVGLIPECAMQVARSVDGGDLVPFSPDAPCSCYYASKISGASGTPAGCAVCSSEQDCADGGGHCSHGFCEVAHALAAPAADGGACFGGAPTAHREIINACTSAQRIAKVVALPSGDGGLTPLP